jgi:reactive intermediate/imine deaminase
MIKKIETSEAPQAIGPYSQALVANGLVFCSGQIGLDPKTGALVEGGLTGQARQVIKNLQAVLERAGTDPERVVRTEVYLTDLADFAVLNEIYREFFGGSNPPARATVQVSALPKGAVVEISCIAII